MTPKAPDSAGSPEVDSIASEVPFNWSICLGFHDVGICAYIWYRDLIDPNSMILKKKLEISIWHFDQFIGHENWWVALFYGGVTWWHETCSLQQVPLVQPKFSSNVSTDDFLMGVDWTLGIIQEISGTNADWCQHTRTLEVGWPLRSLRGAMLAVVRKLQAIKAASEETQRVSKGTLWWKGFDGIWWLLMLIPTYA